MSYIKLKDGVPVRYSIAGLKRDNPKVSFPKEPSNALLRQYDVYRLNSAPVPPHDPATQRIENGAIVVDGDAFLQRWEVVNFTDDELAQMLEEKRKAMVVTPRQARLALLGAGQLANIEAAIAALDEPAKSAVEIEWEYAVSVERTSTWVVTMTEALGMTPEQVDQLFETAAAL